MKRNRVHVFYLWMWKCEIPVTHVFNSDWFPLYFCMCFWLCFLGLATSLVAQMVKNLPAMQETHVWSLGWEDPLEEGMATHSSILAWRIPWTEEAGWLQSMKSRRVGCNWATDTFLYLDPIFLQWPHLSSFSLVPYAWLYLSPSLFFLSHFLQQILIFEWIFFCQRSSKWLYFGVLWNAYQVYRFLWDINIYVPCQKKDGEGSKKENLVFWL